MLCSSLSSRDGTGSLRVRLLPPSKVTARSYMEHRLSLSDRTFVTLSTLQTLSCQDACSMLFDGPLGSTHFCRIPLNVAALCCRKSRSMTSSRYSTTTLPNSSSPAMDALVSTSSMSIAMIPELPLPSCFDLLIVNASRILRGVTLKLFFRLIMPISTTDVRYHRG
eukprot:760283-Hanusia_phi.AAC.2